MEKEGENQAEETALAKAHSLHCLKSILKVQWRSFIGLVQRTFHFSPFISSYLSPHPYLTLITFLLLSFICHLSTSY